MLGEWPVSAYKDTRTMATMHTLMYQSIFTFSHTGFYVMQVVHTTYRCPAITNNWAVILSPKILMILPSDTDGIGYASKQATPTQKQYLKNTQHSGGYSLFMLMNFFSISIVVF